MFYLSRVSETLADSVAQDLLYKPRHMRWRSDEMPTVFQSPVSGVFEQIGVNIVGMAGDHPRLASEAFKISHLPLRFLKIADETDCDTHQIRLSSAFYRREFCASSANPHNYCTPTFQDHYPPPLSCRVYSTLFMFLPQEYPRRRRGMNCG
jgi:hypothetical protein